MPLFRSIFPKKPVPRRKSLDAKKNAIDFDDDVHLTLADNLTFKFDQTNGTWVFDKSTSDDLMATLQADNERLTNELKIEREEKNLVMLKFEILLDLCSQRISESHLKDREIDKLRAIIESG